MNAGYSPELDGGGGVDAGAGSGQVYGEGRWRRGVPRSGQSDGPAPLAVGQGDGALRSGGGGSVSDRHTDSHLRAALIQAAGWRSRRKESEQRPGLCLV